MNKDWKAVALLVAALGIPALLVIVWGSQAKSRLASPGDTTSAVAIASVSEDTYCTPRLKEIVRKVASACGLVDGAGGARGCQPMQAKKVASLSGGDFNALFRPLSKRAQIIQFDPESTKLDPSAMQSVEKAWADQRGASFFFVVARASPDGDEAYNQGLSRDRAQSVLTHLQDKFQDPDLQRQVGLLWLGEEFAQLDASFCDWERSRTGRCSPSDINRSAFVAWIDCSI